MAFEELKEDLADAQRQVRSYLNYSGQYLELRIFKILTRSVTLGLQTILVGLGVMFTLFFVSLGISLWLCEILDSYFLGFLVVGAIYLFVTFGCYILRKRLNRPVLKASSRYYFDQS